MIKKIISSFTIVFSMAFSMQTVYSQMIFSFVPEVYARTIDGLGTFKVQNFSSNTYKGQVSIIVKENISRHTIVSILTPSAIFRPGINNFQRGLFSNSSFKFSGNAYASIVSQTRNFPPGEYSFCYKFIPANKQLSEEFENCFDAAIQPLLPINLLLPAEGDSICLKRPVLSWQPPMPFNASMRFRLLLTEKKGGVSTEAIIKNAPLLLLDNVPSTSLNYPANNPELKEGKTYCWQVVAYQNGLVVSTSEIWEFTIKCKESTTPDVIDSYRDLKLLQNGNYYIANRFLKFSFLNNYNVSKLNYSIHDIENREEALKGIPQVNINPGLNKIDIDLSELKVNPNKYYLLKVLPFNEAPITIRFIYKEE